ncbi:hypothetical protein HS961_02885 [Comamonas piscis]|uniref:Uncharacterized protein n=1 Tax=Comamonas piscis TaxID=1562974 RepID=A0A7G5ECY7_9BURK|nr:hypothetical protein [Comamonas piscis]QMV71862.1 hypothetical protein HS961_02885 [Comamonas piscis]WSO34596.1 hypothetical protein VUJ63_02900 [Comamonas piscis]
MIPRTYAQWRHCITVECGIPLSADFIALRLAVWRNPELEETQRFRRLYGDAHWQAVQRWFVQAAQEQEGAPAVSPLAVSAQQNG